MNPGVRAAVDVGRLHGLGGHDPVVVQETNNCVVWLRPDPVIGKVGTRADSAEMLVREHAVARALVDSGAPVAEPLVGTSPAVHGPTGFVVTLWHRLEHDETIEPDAVAVGRSLLRVHELMASTRLELPDFRTGLRRARRVLDCDAGVPALAPSDVRLLRAVFDELLPALDGRSFASHPLHGEPHDANRLCTPQGIRWIDFESACRGPLEWDVVFLPEAAREVFPDLDAELLALLSLLNQARVATWCWLRAEFPEMRWHGQHHLDAVRHAWRARPPAWPRP